MGALHHGAAGAVFDNRVRLSVRAKNRLDRTVADDGMHAIGSRDYVAVSEVNAIVVSGSDDGKRVRAGADYGRYVAIGSEERSNAGLRLVVVKHGPSNHLKGCWEHYSLRLGSSAYEEGRIAATRKARDAAQSYELSQWRLGHLAREQPAFACQLVPHLHVSGGAFLQAGLLLVGQGTLCPCGRSDDEHAVRDARRARHERSGPDKAVIPDYGAVEHRGPHADERMVADCTAVYHRGMTDGYVMADDRGRTVAHVQAGALLHVRALPQPHEAVAVTPDGRVEQDAALVADGDVADDGRVGRHVRGGRDGGGFVRLLHGHPSWTHPCAYAIVWHGRTLPIMARLCHGSLSSCQKLLEIE